MMIKKIDDDKIEIIKTYTEKSIQTKLELDELKLYHQGKLKEIDKKLTYFEVK